MGVKSSDFEFKNIKFVLIMSINNTLSSIELKVNKLVVSYTELKKKNSELDSEKTQLFEKCLHPKDRWNRTLHRFRSRF